MGRCEEGRAIRVSPANIRLEVRLYFGDKKISYGLMSWRRLIKGPFYQLTCPSYWLRVNASTAFYPTARYNLSLVHYPHRQLLID
jgi:hypothetical protein